MHTRSLFHKLLLTLCLIGCLTPIHASNDKIVVAGLVIPELKNWNSTPTEALSQLAEWTFQNSKLGDVELSIFNFGDKQPNDIVANVDRWKTLVTTQQGAPSPAEVVSFEMNQLKFTRITLYGIYARPSHTPGIPPIPQPKFGFMGIAIAGPEGNVYIRIAGPEASLKAQSGVIDRWLSNIKISSSIQPKKAS